MRFKIFWYLLLFLGGIPLFVYGQNDFLPKVFNRSSWFKGEEVAPTTTSIYKKPEFIILHDLECPVLLSDGKRNPNCNSDTVDSLSIIYNTYLFHKYVKNYGDIGYHFIIDRLGNIYRGRDGQNGISGADAYDKDLCVSYDIGSISIALLGNYEQESIPTLQYEALKKLTGFLIYANSLSSTTNQMLWQADRMNGTCSLNGDFKYSYNGSTILRHSDIDKTHRDLAGLDLNQFRSEVFNEAKRYSNYLFSVKSQDLAKNRLYEFSGGKLIEKTKIGNFVLELNPEMADFFESALSLGGESIANHKLENTIVKVRNKPFYYLIKGGKRSIIIAEILNLEPYKNLRRIELDETRLLEYVLDEPVQFPDNFLVKQKGDYKIFLSQDSVLHRISSSLILKENKNLAKLSLIEIDPASFRLLKIGAPLYPLDGTLVKSANSLKIYYLEKGRKRHIVSYDVFKQYKFSSAKIMVLSEDELDDIPLGEPLYHKDGSLLKISGGDSIYYIEGGRRFQINDRTILTKLGFSNKNIRQVDADDLNFYRDGGKISNEDDFKKIPELLLSFKKRDNINPEIRVLLKEYEFSPSALNETIRVRANGPFSLVDGENKEIENLMQDNTLTFRIGDILRNYNLPIIFKGRSDDVVLETDLIDINSGSRQISRLRGEILVTYNPYGNGSFLIINKVKVEDYLKGIGGFGVDDQNEFLKAAAITLRSYVLAKFYFDKPDYQYYDIRRTEEGLIYVGYDNEVALPNLVKAVNETYGYVLWYNEDLALARFSLDTGGLSRDARQIFGAEYEKYPFLWGGIEDFPSTKHLVDYIKISHGVGLSLQGAREMAAHGLNSEAILSRYYLGTEIKKIY